MRTSFLLLLGAALATAACAGTRRLPPLGEAVVIVDTDASVPLLVSRLRVDAFTTDGRWYASQDFELPDPADWPASFGVYSPDPRADKTVVLRLRAYGAGNVRDYRGERYAPRPSGADPSADAPIPPPPRRGAPRLLATDGADITPGTEPQPLLAIDRLVRLTVKPGKVESLRVVLRGACFGTMADLATSETCVDAENERSRLTESALDRDLSVPSTSLQGSFGLQGGCRSPPRPAGSDPAGAPLDDEEVCVRGGAFVLGSEALAGNGIGTATPERIAVIPSFRMDRYEVTVARWRKALSEGFSFSTPPVVENNVAGFPTSPLPADIYGGRFCTFSSAPLGRETFPLGCISWDTARAFCQFEGGDLPTESQWEYAAMMSGRAAKTAFPWGGPDDVDPVCAQCVFGRGYNGTLDPSMVGECTKGGFGPLDEAAALYASHDAPAGVIGEGDATVGLGVANLGGNLAEWVLDTAYSMSSNCWMSQPLTLPSCVDPAGVNRTVRGGSWDLPTQDTFSGYRLFSPHNSISPNEGFRCVRRGGP